MSEAAVEARSASVIVCTHNRAGPLARLLGQLRRQDYTEGAFEIVVVDNRSTDGTAALVEALGREPGVPVRYVAENRAAITWARNRGAEVAQFETLAYIDDDCTAGPDWLQQLTRGFDLDPRVEVVGGRVVVDWDGQPVPRWYGREVERSLAGTSHLGEKARILVEEPRVIECNMAVRRAAWQTGGGFLGMEQFGSRHCAAGEVIPLLDRIIRRGGRVAFIPEAVVCHHAGKRDLRWMVARAYWQGVSDGLMDALLDRRSGAGVVRRVGVDAAALLALSGLCAASIFKGSLPLSLSQLLRAVRRLGLLLCELHLAGDWRKLRAWTLAEKAAGREVSNGGVNPRRGMNGVKFSLPFSQKRLRIGDIPRIALVGCGAIAESYYLPALARFRPVMEKLVLVDPDRDRAEQMAARFGSREIRPDYRQITREVDGAILAVPTHLHFPIARDFLSLGVPVLCEKPLAESAAQAEALVELARQSNTALAANYLQRLIPSFAKVKELLAGRSLGEIRSIHYQVGEDFDWPTWSGFYFNSNLAARGVLRDRGAHVMDHVCWWLEKKPEVVSSQNDSFGGSEALALIRFAAGVCRGQVMLSWLGRFPSRYTIVCDGGTITGDVYDYRGFTIRDGQGRARRVRAGGREDTKLKIASKVIENFIQVIVQGERPLIEGREVLDSLRFVDECYAAASRLEMPWYEFGEVERVR